MRPREILFLYRARFGHRPTIAQELLAVLGLCVAVALIFASLVATTSLSGVLSASDTAVFGNLQIEVRARGAAGFDGALVSRTARLQGVSSLLPVLDQQAVVAGPGGQRAVTFVGFDPRRATGAGTLLHRLSNSNFTSLQVLGLAAPIAKAIGVGVLGSFNLQINGRSHEVTLGAVLGPSDLNLATVAQLAFTGLPYAQQLDGLPDRITRLFVGVTPGHEAAVTRELDRLYRGAPVNIEPAREDATLFHTSIAAINQSNNLFAAISAILAFVFALNVLLMTATQRRATVTFAKLSGATRAMITQLLAFDGLIVGALAGVLGLGLGELLSSALFTTNPGYLGYAFPFTSVRIVTWEIVVLAISSAVAMAWLGIFVSVSDLLVGTRQRSSVTRSLARLRPIARATGLLAAALAAAIVPFVATRLALVAYACLFITTLAVLPQIFDRSAAAYAWYYSRTKSTAALLAGTGLREPTTRSRTLAIMATAAVALLGCVSIQGAQTTLTRGLDGAGSELSANAPLWITPTSSRDVPATTPFAPFDPPTLAAVPGVASVGAYRSSFLNWSGHLIWVMGMPANASDPAMSGQLPASERKGAAAALRAGNGVVISKTLATAFHLHIGDAFVLPTPTPTGFRVAAIGSDMGWSPGTILMSTSDYATAWQSPFPTAYLVQVQRGANIYKVQRALRVALAGAGGVDVQTAAQRAGLQESATHSTLARFTQIRILLLLAAIVAVATAHGALIAKRRPLLAYLRCQGYSSTVILRSLALEAVAIVGVSCLAGSLLGLFGQLVMTRVLVNITGFPALGNLDLGAGVANCAIVLGATIALVTVPAVLASRVRPSSTLEP